MQCQCIKGDGDQCTRPGSKNSSHSSEYCWQHQSCKTTKTTKPTKLKVKVKEPKTQAKIKPKPTTKIKKTKETHESEFKYKGSCGYKIHEEDIGRSNQWATFDYDDTLAKRGTSEWLFEEMKETLVELSKTHTIIVFTNQNGIPKGHTTKETVENLFNEFDTNDEFNINYFYSTIKDQYRKPMTGMFDLAQTLLGPCDRSNSFYCGDAAGRAKDHDITDRYFAENLTLEFKTPEDLLKKRNPHSYAPQKKDVYTKRNINIRKHS